MTQTGGGDNIQCVCTRLYILPSRKKLGDLCPAVAEAFVGLINDSILVLSP